MLRLVEGGQEIRNEADVAATFVRAECSASIQGSPLERRTMARTRGRL